MLRRELIDEVIPVEDEDAFQRQNALLKSKVSMLAFQAEQPVGRHLNWQNARKSREADCGYFPDTGERYLSVGKKFMDNIIKIKYDKLLQIYKTSRIVWLLIPVVLIVLLLLPVMRHWEIKPAGF